MKDKTALKILGWFNFWIVQWFFIRITRKYNDHDVCIGHGVLRWVYPLTGWTNNYKFIRKM